MYKKVYCPEESKFAHYRPINASAEDLGSVNESAVEDPNSGSVQVFSVIDEKENVISLYRAQIHLKSIEEVNRQLHDQVGQRVYYGDEKD